MTRKVYTGSCHCSAVKYEAKINLAEGTTKCNCSICTKTRAWVAMVSAENFKWLKGETAQTEYQWASSPTTAPVLHYQFCKTCGTRTPGWGEHESMSGKWFFIPVTTLDDATIEELVAAPVKCVDGRHDRFSEAAQGPFLS